MNMLYKHQQLSQAEKEKLLAEYIAGASLMELSARSCATDFPLSQQVITKVLAEMGAKIRNRVEAAVVKKQKPAAYYRGY